MKLVELYGKVRYAVQIEGISRREAARRFGIDPRTVAKMLSFSVPPGYRRSRPAKRPKLDPFTGIIDRILEEDQSRPAKQRHTSKRIFVRLREEHGYCGRLTSVKDYVLVRRQRQREVFVPLRHDPGHAQADFGAALAVIGGMERTIHFFVMDLPHSDAGFVQAYPAETTEAFCAGHVAAFAFFGKVPASILYDNTKLAVARILGDDLHAGLMVSPSHGVTKRSGFFAAGIAGQDLADLQEGGLRAAGDALPRRAPAADACVQRVAVTLPVGACRPV